MELKLNRNVHSVARFGNGQPGRVRATTQPVPATEFALSQALEARLSALPGTRSEVVARGRSLLHSPDYPPREMIQKIATLLAIGMVDNAEVK